MIGDVSVSRMIVGSNSLFGFSHSSAARDKQIKETMTSQRMADVIEVFLNAGIDTIMGLVQFLGFREAIEEAEQRAGHKDHRLVLGGWA